MFGSPSFDSIIEFDKFQFSWKIMLFYIFAHDFVSFRGIKEGFEFWNFTIHIEELLAKDENSIKIVTEIRFVYNINTIFVIPAQFYK